MYVFVLNMSSLSIGVFIAIIIGAVLILVGIIYYIRVRWIYYKRSNDDSGDIQMHVDKNVNNSMHTAVHV